MVEVLGPERGVVVGCQLASMGGIRWTMRCGFWSSVTIHSNMSGETPMRDLVSLMMGLLTLWKASPRWQCWSDEKVSWAY